MRSVNKWALASQLWTCLCVAVMITSCDIFCIELAQSEWGWSVMSSSFYIGFIMLALIPISLSVSFIIKKTGVSDRRAIPILFGACLVCTLLFINWPGLLATHVVQVQGAFDQSAFRHSGNQVLIEPSAADIYPNLESFVGRRITFCGFAIRRPTRLQMRRH